jgi:hypothetical protein
MSETQAHKPPEAATNAPPIEAEGNVTQLFARNPAKRREPPLTDEEIAEFRRLRPLLIKMLADWGTLSGPTGCPVVHHILGDP